MGTVGVGDTANSTEVARSNMSAFDQWWQRQGEWVEVANERRGGISGVQRLNSPWSKDLWLYSKRQVGHIYRSFRHPFGRPTALREKEAIIALSGLNIEVPKMVFCEARRQQGDWQALLVTEELKGFIDLEDWYTREHSPQELQAVLEKMAMTIARLHQNRWQHGCLYPKHIFIHQVQDEEPRVALLDLEKCRKRWFWRKASKRDIDQLKRHIDNMPKQDWDYFYSMYTKQLELISGT